MGCSSLNIVWDARGPYQTIQSTEGSFSKISTASLVAHCDRCLDLEIWQFSYQQQRQKMDNLK